MRRVRPAGIPPATRISLSQRGTSPMFKTIAAATATVALALGLSLVAVAPASAEGVSNNASFYETPNTGEKCDKWTPPGDTTTVTAASFSIPAGATLTKVVIKAGNTGASGQGPE